MCDVRGWWQGGGVDGLTRTHSRRRVGRAERRRMVVRRAARALHHRPRPRGGGARLPVRGVRQPAAARPAMSAALLEVSGLTVRHRRDLIVDGVDLRLARGEALGLAGESGCGKSTTALSLMRLLPAALEQEGTILLHPPDGGDTINIDRRTERGMPLMRWRPVE